MRISAKADYAVRAMVELAATADEKPVKAERIATAQDIPLNFLENILGGAASRRTREVTPRCRGRIPPREDRPTITMADVIRAVEGPLASVRGAPPEESQDYGASEALLRVWIAVRANLRKVVEQVTVADIAGGRLPLIDRQAGRRPRDVGHPLAALAFSRRGGGDAVSCGCGSIGEPRSNPVRLGGA